MDPREHVVLVYQFGKVASTALVQSLNACPNVTAYQSHFLGDDALKRIVVNATGPNLSPYFREHMVGQLVNNLELTHKMKRLQTGKDPRALTVVSLAREPLDWFRSSVQQDIAGYEENFRSLAGATGAEGAQAVQDGIVTMLAQVLRMLEEEGGAQDVVTRIIANGGRSVTERLQTDEPFLKTQFLLSLRPLTWFEDHYRKCFGFSLEDMTRHGAVWFRRDRRAGHVVLRYEDISTAFAPAMKLAAVPFAGDIKWANQSRTKPFASEIRAAFSSDVAVRLGRALRLSDYGRFFAYQEVGHQADGLVAVP